MSYFRGATTDPVSCATLQTIPLDDPSLEDVCYVCQWGRACNASGNVCFDLNNCHLNGGAQPCKLWQTCGVDTERSVQNNQYEMLVTRCQTSTLRLLAVISLGFTLAALVFCIVMAVITRPTRSSSAWNAAMERASDRATLKQSTAPPKAVAPPPPLPSSST